MGAERQSADLSDPPRLPAPTRVLAAGCNRGGFLRLLAARCQIAAGDGYDPAAGAMDDAHWADDARRLTTPAGSRRPPARDARRLAGALSLSFEVGDA